LDTHHATLVKNPRTALMAKSIERLSDAERQAIRDYSDGVLATINAL
jgi:deoxyribodipyrimidine photolyase-like uncharacterized protein